MANKNPLSKKRPSVFEFQFNKKELWQFVKSKGYFINPVLKRVYVSLIPFGIALPYCNISALSQYGEINPDYQEFYAIEKKQFNHLKNNGDWVVTDDIGTYCLEIWKYNPMVITGHSDFNQSVVDPLSLYLSLKDSEDERIQLALDQLINDIL